MLEFLRIRNLALIEDMELEFGAGLNALTGETGAGKSFIMRAVDFLTGERMDKDLVRPGADKASVEAVFALEDGERLIRRELSAETGRSRIFMDDALGSQEAVRALRPKLVSHPSQHGQQQLLKPSVQARIVDSFVPDKGLLASRKALMEELRGILEEQEALKARCADLERTREFLEHQREQIDKVGPRRGEEEELLEMKQRFQAREKTRAAVGTALEILRADGGPADALADLGDALGHLAALDPDLDEEREAVTEFRHRLSALESRLMGGVGAGDAPDMDPDAVESRLFELSKLKRQLNRGLDEILDLHTEIEENLSFLDSCNLDLKQLQAKEADAAERLGGVLTKLNAARRKVAEALTRDLEAELRQLGFDEHVQVRVRFEEAEAYPGLHDLRARMLWVPNPGQQPQPLDRIASGGELSRFLLALTALGVGGSGEGLATLIFDEVDAGIGGLTLGRVGEKLRDLAERRQVLLITHWPQLARLAGRHFLVSKEVEDGQTYTRCRRLDEAEVRGELARMAGGGEQGDALAEKLVG